MENLKKIKRAVNNTIRSDKVEINGKIYTADDYLMTFKRKLTKWNFILSLLAPVVWFFTVSFIGFNSQLFNFIILLIMCAIFWFIHDYLVMQIIPDDCFKHLQEV